MTNFILISICILSGLSFRYFGKLPKDSHKSINAWILYIALPAVSFKYLPTIKWSYELLLPLLSPIIIFIFAKIFVSLFKKIYKIDNITESILILTCGLSNTSFIGFPLVMSYFGEENLNIAVIIDQITFILLSSVGLITILKTNEKERIDPKKIFLRLIKFPPFISFILALTLPFFVDLSYFKGLFDKLASTVGPMALFSVGLQLQFSDWKKEIKLLSFALTYKLIIAPLILLIIVLFLNLKGIIPQISIFEACMPTLISSSIILDEYKIDTKLCNLIIGFSIIISFITTFFWSIAIKAIL